MRPRPLPAILLVALLLLPVGGADFTVEMRGPFSSQAPAVAELADGRLVGTLATVHVTVSRPAGGAGGAVFLDTRPLMQLDMQGSARMAARVAAALAGVNATDFDVFIAVRSSGSVIGGPSAGALATVLILGAMTGHPPKDDVVLTGAVLPDGSIGPVGGVPQKAQAAASAGKRLFLFPAGLESVPLEDGGSLDLPAYCRDALAITCRPVVTVEDAFAAMTGFALERPTPGDPVTGAESAAVLRPAAEQLFANATALRAEAEQALANLTIPPDLGAVVVEARRRADEALAASWDALNRSQPYTSASKSFQASIESRALVEYAGWQRSGRSPAYVDAAVSRADEVADVAARTAEAATAETVVQLQALGAAQTRAREAQDLVASARNATLPTVALREAAFAIERSGTVHWWLSIGKAFPPGRAVVQDRLAEAVGQAIDAASDGVAYARALLRIHVPGATLEEPERLLARARAEQERGFLASALFTAIEADVRAGLLFATAGRGVPSATLDTARDAAVDAIARSRAAGVEPVLAVSYLEFANSLRNDTQPNTGEAYVFYQLARAAGRLPDTLRLEEAAGATRFAPVPDDVPRLRVPASWMPAYFAIGIALGATAALVALTRRHGEA